VPRHDRDALARAAGHETWQDAVRATAHLSQQEAGKLLGVSHPTIRVWRKELGVAVATDRPDADQRRAAFAEDLTDPRHGTPNGYRNLGCRCPACTRAWTDYSRDRRTTP
jgi:hypothetical protein